MVESFSPSNWSVMRMRFFRNLSTGLVAMSGSCPAANHIFTPVTTRNAPNTYSSQWKVASSQAPARMSSVRSTMAPMMPMMSARFWYCGGTAK
ncbi:hypothetical protein D3C71_1958860 [compost metagenome]